MIAYLRRIAWEARLLRCSVEALWPVRNELEPTFIVGCGRSGTTLLGEVLGRHADIFVLNEPRDRWYVIDPRTDDIGLYGKGGCLDLRSEDVNDKARANRQLVSAALSTKHYSKLIEKSPAYIFRAHWLRELFPNCRFINIQRDGRAVIRSIVGLARANTYKMAPVQGRNQWWGKDCCKRDLLLHRAERHGLLSDSWDLLNEETLDATAAAVEWIMSVDAADDLNSSVTTGQMHNVRYESLLSDGSSTVANVLEFMGVQNRCSEELVKIIRRDDVNRRTESDCSKIIVDPVTHKHMNIRLMQLGYAAANTAP